MYGCPDKGQAENFLHNVHRCLQRLPHCRTAVQTEMAHGTYDTRGYVPMQDVFVDIAYACGTRLGHVLYQPGSRKTSTGYEKVIIRHDGGGDDMRHIEGNKAAYHHKRFLLRQELVYVYP